MVAFHVRWRDVARGGLRMSVPVSYGDHAIRAMSAYDEAYALSFAQQLKNKDIPGARATHPDHARLTFHYTSCCPH